MFPLLLAMGFTLIPLALCVPSSRKFSFFASTLQKLLNFTLNYLLVEFHPLDLNISPFSGLEISPNWRLLHLWKPFSSRLLKVWLIVFSSKVLMGCGYFEIKLSLLFFYGSLFVPTATVLCSWMSCTYGIICDSSLFNLLLKSVILCGRLRFESAVRVGLFDMLF